MPEIPRLDPENSEILTKVNLTFAVRQFFIQCIRVHLGCGVDVLASILFNSMVMKPNLNGVNASPRVKFSLLFFLKINVDYIFMNSYEIFI